MTPEFLPYEVGASKPRFTMEIISVINWNFLEVSVLASNSLRLGNKKAGPW
jgi:hypothetical protein